MVVMCRLRCLMKYFLNIVAGCVINTLIMLQKYLNIVVSCGI